MSADTVKRAALVSIACLLAAAAGCGGKDAAPIKIGVLTACGGPFGQFEEATLAGAELPFLQRGGRLRGRRPENGAEASVAGRRVELVVGCEGGTFGTMLAAARRLVEEDRVAALVGPLAVPYGSVLRLYAQKQPGTVFSIALSGEQGLTLRHPMPNVFRFGLDEAGWMAGLGAYAYKELGWRTAVTVAEDAPHAWTEVAGFIAEFCSLGGKVVKRIWPPFFSADLSGLVSQIPATADGVLLGDGNLSPDTFFAAYRSLHPDLPRHLVIGPYSLFFAHVTDRLLGLVAGSPFVTPDTPASAAYIRDLNRSFPSVAPSNGFAMSYYDATEPLLEALEQVKGDLSHGERRLMATIAHLRLDAPNGPIRLDANHQAIASNYLLRVQRSPNGRLGVGTFRIVRNVDESFNGYFGPGSLEPSRTQPACKRGNPPSWAR
jgi:branched-chain amino acid transport system substrate-binding protein